LSTNIENCQQRQDDLDSLYRDFCEIYYSEMEQWFQTKNVLPIKKKKLKKCCKPFWCDELQILWNDLRHKEKIFCQQEVMTGVNAEKNLEMLNMILIGHTENLKDAFREKTY
jgi:hypothetical protein